MANTARELMAQFIQAMDSMDFAALERLMHPDYVGEYPQSRERFRGFSAFRAQLEQYPEGVPAGSSQTEATVMFGDEDRWVVTPGYTVLPLAGPDRYTAVLRTRYPDGSYWHVITIIEFRDGLIGHSTTYFAPEFEPPEWRAGITERY
jgi:ketosteroid isomerase-like protein